MMAIASDNPLEVALTIFESCSYTLKCQFIDSLILKCGTPELSYIHGVLENIIRVDFLTQMPVEVREHIIHNLDPETVEQCRFVCKSWNSVILNSSSAHLVLMRGLGANSSICMESRTFVDIKKLYNDIIEAHMSLQTGCGITSKVLEGHADRVCALHYSDGMLSSCSHDGTARIANLKHGFSFERLIQCAPSASIKLASVGLIAAQFDGDLSLHSFSEYQNSLVFRGHTAAVHCVDLCEQKNLLISGGADWKVITWRLVEGELIKVFSSHSAAVLELVLEHVQDFDRSYVHKGGFVLYSKDRNVCQVNRLEEPFDRMVVLKTLRSIDGHIFKHGMIVNRQYLVLNTRLKVHLWSKVSLELVTTVSCEHLLTPDLLGWGAVFGLLVDLFGLHVIQVSTGKVVYSISVNNLRNMDRTDTRFIAGDVRWLDGFTGHDSSPVLYACAMNNSFNVEVTSWLPKTSSRTTSETTQVSI